jgi:predicted nucleic acid-binding protein
MAEIVLDANVIVALLYADDSQHQRAVQLTERLEAEGHSLVLIDFLVFEALSVLCRRAAQRKTTPPNLTAAVQTMRRWLDAGEVRFLAH